MLHKPNLSLLWAVLAAALYAISTPASKVFLNELSPTMMAALLYLGAGIGMSAVKGVRHFSVKASPIEKMTVKQLPYILGMVLLDIAAPILMMTGLSSAAAENASLLNNFEIVATSLIALLVFKERMTKRLWIAIVLITLSTMMLSFEGSKSLSFSFGSVFVILACICWGVENNFTRKLSGYDPMSVTIIKGFGSGTGSLLIAWVLGQTGGNVLNMAAALLLGFVSYGLSIYFYVTAQRTLGAAKTSACYAVSPFLGAFLSLILFRQLPNLLFFAALILMAVGAYYTTTDHK